jgi:hypothetical protein
VLNSINSAKYEIEHFSNHEGHEEHEEKQKKLNRKTQRTLRKTKAKNRLLLKNIKDFLRALRALGEN